MNKYVSRVLWWLLLIPAFSACINETEVISTEEGGKISLSLGDVVTAVTRSTPAELGKPLAAQFTVSVIGENGHAVYNGPFVADDEARMEISVPTGLYAITAEYGDNPLIGRDTPYYIGAEYDVKVINNEPTQVELTCKVGNALVSARFDEPERFSRYFNSYGLYVSLGENSLGITHDDPQSSVYVRAGSSVELSFRGNLADGTPFSYSLESEQFPDVLNARDHAIVTLTMPDPENSLTVNISKVEMDTLNLDETIPLSWLPKPRMTVEHQYDEKGELVGTDLAFNDAYPGVTWKAVITNENGETVRELTDRGALTSAYHSSSEWPYLPKGTYNATYYIVSDDKETKINEDTFSVPDPDLTLTVGGYTAHTKWEEGDVDAANACERLTVYEPSVYVNVSNALMSNAHYAQSFVCSYNNQALEVPADNKSNTIVWANRTNQAVSGTPYILKGSMTFAGTAVQEKQKELRITGLPVNFDPPKENTGWFRTQGTVNFNSDHVRLGNWSWSNPHAMRNNTWVNIPVGTRLCLDYKIAVNHGTVKTTVTVMAGGQELLKSQDEELLDGESLRTSQTITASSNITQLDCEGSWGSASTHSLIYRLYFKYAK